MPTDLDAQGTEAAPAAGSGASDALAATLGQDQGAPAAPPDPEAEFSRRLETLDPSRLPESVRERLNKPFLADYTRKMQELSRERDRLLDRVLPKETAPDERQTLRQRIKDGDWDALEPFVQKEIAARLGPVESQVALSNAIARAQQMHPFVKEKEAEIGQMFAADPTLLQMAQADNFRFAPYVLQGAAMALENQSVKAALDQERAERAKLVKEEVAKISQAAKGLPPQTSKAGTTPTATPSKAGKVLGFYGAAVQALDEAGEPVDPYVRRMAEEGR